MENQFNVGDLVWAKLHSHPWWPSIIYHEALTSTEVQQAKKEGFVLVSFFGNNSYKWLDPKTLLPFESNYNACLNRSRSRLYVKAVNEAIYEINHRAALGLTCPCLFFSSYRPAPAEGLLEVDIDGYQSGGVYSVQQIDRLRQEFLPVETLSFVRLLALDSTSRPQDLNFSKEVGRVFTFRKAKYAEVDEPYFLAFGVDPTRLGDPLVTLNSEETSLIQAPSDHPLESASQGQKKPAVKRQNKDKICLAPQKDKLHDTKTKHSVKRNQCADYESKVSQYHVPRKKSRGKVKFEKRLDFTSASDDKKESSPSLFKESSMSTDGKSVESSTTAAKSDDVHVVEKARPSDAFVSSKTKKVQYTDPFMPSKPKKVQSSDTSMPSESKKVQYSDPFMQPSKTKKVPFADPSMPSKTCLKGKSSPLASKPSKKQQQSISPEEGQKMLLASSPQKRRKIGDNITRVKAPKKGSKRILSMKFPPDAAMPSSAELEAMFVRFGPLDASGTRISSVKSRCWVVFMNRSDAIKAYTDAVKSEKMFGQTNITYKLLGEVTESNLVERGISGSNTVCSLQQEETPVIPPHAPVFSHSTYDQIEHRYQEIYAKYQEQKDQTCVQVKQASPDISKEFLYLLNKCSQIVMGSKAA